VIAATVALFLALPAMLLRAPWMRERAPHAVNVGGSRPGKPTAPDGVERSMAQFTMYSTGWCIFCRRLKMQLDEAGIAYHDVDIETDPEAAAFVEGVNHGNQVVPTLRYADGSTATNPSFVEVRAKLAA